MRIATRHVLAVAAASLLAAACAPAKSAGANTATTSQHNTITAAELERAGDVSLYDALRQLRPAFLRPHGGQGVMTGERVLQVYVGEERMEGIDHLRNISVRTVKEVRFLEPQQANARFGGNNGGGALIVTLM